MSVEQMQLVTSVLSVAIALLAAALILLLGKTYHPFAAIRKTYVRIDGYLHEKKSLFDYEENQRFLKSHGAAEHFGAWIDPVKYLGIRICLAATGFVIGIQYHSVIGVICTIIGFQLPYILCLYMNNKDNQKMMVQIQTLYSLLQVQIHAGVGITDALAESYHSFPPGRMRNALEEFSNSLYINGSFADSLEVFNSKFNNGFVDSLCVILQQARESGQAVDLLRDISQQIADMQSVLLIKRKEKLNRISTFCLLGVLTSMLGITLYAIIQQMYQSAVISF